jgi:hypothetical protein
MFEGRGCQYSSNSLDRGCQYSSNSLDCGCHYSSNSLEPGEACYCTSRSYRALDCLFLVNISSLYGVIILSDQYYLSLLVGLRIVYLVAADMPTG